MPTTAKAIRQSLEPSVAKRRCTCIPVIIVVDIVWNWPVALYFDGASVV